MLASTLPAVPFALKRDFPFYLADLEDSDSAYSSSNEKKHDYSSEDDTCDVSNSASTSMPSEGSDRKKRENISIDELVNTTSVKTTKSSERSKEREALLSQIFECPARLKKARKQPSICEGLNPEV